MNSRLKRISQTMIRKYHRLTLKKYRAADKLFIVEGIRSVAEVLASDWDVDAVLVQDEQLCEQFAPDIARRDVPCYQLSVKEMGLLSDTVTSQGIVSIVRTGRQPDYDEFLMRKGPQMIVALDSVADPGNVGTIIRTCDWFGADAVLLDETTVELFNPKVIRSAMGSVFHLPVFTDIGLASALTKAKERGFTVVTTVMHGGKSPEEFVFPSRTVLVLGSEAHGVSRDAGQLAGERMTIPRYGKAESLNVAIACGIILAKRNERGRRG